MKPLVSIVIPNYNYGHFIRETMESAVHQTYDNIEIVVVDDGSTDNSVEIVNEYVEKFDNVTLYKNGKNLGVVGNHNRAVELSHGEYIVVLSSDDYLDIHFVEECVKKFEQHPSAGMVVSAMHLVDDKGNVTDAPNYYGSSFICKGIYQCKVFLMSNTFVPSQVLFKRECIENPAVGGAFSGFADTFIDTELWYRICLHYDFLYFDQRLCYYRSYIGSYSKSYDNLKGAMQYYLLRQHWLRLAKDNEYIQSYKDEAIRRTPLFCIRSIRNLLVAGEFRTAKRYLRLAEAIDLNIADSKYYELVEKFIADGACGDMDELNKAQGEYLDSLKSEESKMVSNSAPYALPDGAVIIEG
ncbi:MAG: glycosyltransferase family 2 protein [Lachnospira sp.]|nr:glycosyltransferase family 2 protein [Lachnospira sp.]